MKSRPAESVRRKCPCAQPLLEYRVVAEAPSEAVIELYKAGGWWRESQAWREAIPAMIRGSYCFMLALAPDGRAVGMGRVLSDGVSDAYIQDVVVVPELRGQGVGSEIIERLTAHCRAQGIGWIGLVAEPGTQPFYEGLGYHALEGYQPMLFAAAK